MYLYSPVFVITLYCNVLHILFTASHELRVLHIVAALTSRTIAIDQRKCDSHFRRRDSHLKGGLPKFKIALTSTPNFSTNLLWISWR